MRVPRITIFVVIMAICAGFMFNDLFVVHGEFSGSQSSLDRIIAAATSINTGEWDCYDDESQAGVFESILVPCLWQQYSRRWLIGEPLKPIPEATDLFVEVNELLNAAYYHSPLHKSYTQAPSSATEAGAPSSANDVEGNQSKYDFKTDPEWQKRCLIAEKRLRSLITKFRKENGLDRTSVAILSEQLARLYDCSGNGDSKELEKFYYDILTPACPKCKRSDKLVMLSPPPMASRADLMKCGSWGCDRCNGYFLTKNGMVSRECKPYPGEVESVR